MSQLVVGERQIERFHRKYSVNETTGCWEWLGHLSPDGYGRIYLDGKQVRAHRASYLVHHGTFDISLNICHSCDNPSCVNPKHLYAGTQGENMDDKKKRNRSKGINRGPSNGASKLSDSDVMEIRDLLTSKLFSQKFISIKYGVDQSHISGIKTGRKLNY